METHPLSAPAHLAVALLSLAVLSLAACAPAEADLEGTVEAQAQEQVRATIDAMPTATPTPGSTATPTPTAIPTPTPTATATPTVTPTLELSVCNIDVPYDETTTSITEKEGRVVEVTIRQRYSGQDSEFVLTDTSEGAVINRFDRIIVDDIRYWRLSSGPRSEEGLWVVDDMAAPPQRTLRCVDPSSVPAGGEGAPHYTDTSMAAEVLVEGEEPVAGTMREEYWFEPSGRPARLMRTFLPGEASAAKGYTVEFTFSGYGEPNDITPPDVRHLGLVAVKGEGVSCDLTTAAYAESVFAHTYGETVRIEVKHVGPDEHETWTGRWSRDNSLSGQYERIVKDGTQYYRETDEPGDPPAYGEWFVTKMRDLPWYLPPCLDPGTYDPSSEAPHLTTYPAHLPHFFLESDIVAEWWGDEYGRPTRSAWSWQVEDEPDRATMAIHYGSWGREPVIEAPELGPGTEYGPGFG